jgi:prepilin signal peptidase PulO-like enzyme (type II secretory pathway)
MLSATNGVILFIFGLAFGSFFNVVAMRYDGERFVFSAARLGGRSHCTHCRHTLRWFELVPVVSFLAQRGRCRVCHARLSLAYPLTEFVTGLIFVLVPWRVGNFYGATGGVYIALAALWVAVFCVLLLISEIDLRLGVIPDELTVLLLVLGIAIVAVLENSDTLPTSFLFFFLIGLDATAGVSLGHVVGALAGVGFFGGLWVLTKGRGMGMGDVKLALPLGFLLGWPDIIVAFMASFIIGAAVGVAAIFARRKTMASAIPFGPFLAIGAFVIFLWGDAIVRAYLQIAGIG